MKLRNMLLMALIALQSLSSLAVEIDSSGENALPQTNLLCSPVDELSSMRLILMNGAVGPVKSLELQIFDHGEFIVIADRKIESSKSVVKPGPQGVMKYVGKDVELIHTIKAHNVSVTQHSQATIEIGFDKHRTTLDFNCSIVE